MSTLDYQFNYRRRLPHLQPENATLFVTFRLKDSIPQSVLEQWHQDKLAIEKRLLKILNTKDREIERYKEQRRQFGLKYPMVPLGSRM